MLVKTVVLLAIPPVAEIKLEEYRNFVQLHEHETFIIQFILSVALELVVV